MSEDNAKWLRLYIHAYQATNESIYAEIAQGIAGYLKTWLSDQQNGCFYGSQDADEEYYSRSKAERANLTPPFIDRHVYTDWNAMLISAYLEASSVLMDMSTRDFALKSLLRLLTLNYKRGEGMFHFNDGQPHLQNQLSDQAQTVNTLLGAYETTGETEFLRMAQELMDTAVRKLFDFEHGGFFDTVVDPNAPGFLSKPTKPLDENSIAARVLTRLCYLTGKDNYRKMADDTLKRFVEIYPQFGFMAADYALAVDAFLHEPTIIRIIGSSEKEQTQGLLIEAHRNYEPRKIIQILDPQKDQNAITALGYPISETPTAFICVGRACTAPIIEPQQVAVELNRMLQSQLRK